MATHEGFSLALERVDGYAFRVNFDWSSVPELIVDETEPLGKQQGPNASRLLAAAVGNCLSASLLFCLEKAKIEVRAVQTRVHGTLARNARGRLRVGRIDVEVRIDTAGELQRQARCLDLFEDYCVVTASVRKGIPISVRVVDAAGRELYVDHGEVDTSLPA